MNIVSKTINYEIQIFSACSLAVSIVCYTRISIDMYICNSIMLQGRNNPSRRIFFIPEWDPSPEGNLFSI